MGLLDAYFGNANISRQGARAGVGTRQDNFTGPATAFLGGLLGTAPDQQGGSVLDPGSAINSPNAANAGFMLGTAAQILPLIKGAFSLGNGAADALSFASRSVKIRAPEPLPQRPFSDDYDPQNFTQPYGSRITTDIDGNPISPGAIIVGRRVGGGVDEGLSRSDQDRITGALGISRDAVAARYLPKNSVGSYTSGVTPDGYPVRQIKIYKGLNPEESSNVQSHEFGHAINDIAGVYDPATKYGQIPTNGITAQLNHNYDLLNNRQIGDPLIPRLPSKQATPGIDGYSPSEWDAEKMAEAIRGYGTDPNYFKTVAPDVAARVREFVKNNPYLKDIVHFNSVGPALGVGLLGASNNDATQR